MLVVAAKPLLPLAVQVNYNISFVSGNHAHAVQIVYFGMM